MLRERDEGFIQLTQATSANPNADLSDLEFKLAARSPSGRSSTTWSPVSQKNPQIHQERLEWVEPAANQGLQIFGQGATVRTGFAFSLDNWNLYDASPAWREVTTGTLEEKIRKMKDPAIREALIAETEEADRRLQVIQAGVGGPQGPRHPGRAQHRHDLTHSTRATPSARSPTRRASTPSTSCWTSPSRPT